MTAKSLICNPLLLQMYGDMPQTDWRGTRGRWNLCKFHTQYRVLRHDISFSPIPVCPAMNCNTTPPSTPRLCRLTLNKDPLHSKVAWSVVISGWRYNVQNWKRLMEISANPWRKGAMNEKTCAETSVRQGPKRIQDPAGIQLGGAPLSLGGRGNRAGSK